MTTIGVDEVVDRTFSIEGLKPLRCVDVQPRPSVYAIIEVYALPAGSGSDGSDAKPRPEDLLGSAFFYLFSDSGRLRAGCWRISLTGERSAALQFRVMDGRANGDAQRA